MTTSVWDEQKIRREFPECQTLRDVISRIESEFSKKGEVICEIAINGISLSEVDEAKFADSSARDINSISISTNRPADLIVQSLVSALEFLPGLEAACLKTAEAFRGSDLNRAQKLFQESLEGCQWLVDSLMHIRGAANGIGQPLQQPERWYEAEKLITKVVRELSESYSKNDFLLVADLLEYEITTAFSIWNEALKGEQANR